MGSYCGVKSCRDIRKDPQSRYQISSLTQINYNWTGLEFPVAISKIDRFEKNNPSIAVNVLAIGKGKELYVCHRFKHFNREQVMNLLLLEDKEKRHYVAIKSLSQLLSRENSRYDGSQHFCISCLQGFHSEESQDQHFEFCSDNDAVKVEMLESGSVLKFHDGQYQFKVPFIMYADFESILQPISGCSDNPNNPSNRKIDKHVPSGFCIYSKLAYREVENPLKLYRSEHCVKVFCKYIEEEAKRFYQMFPRKPMEKLTIDQWQSFNQTKRCHICLKEFSEDDIMVRDHCHYIGLYGGPAHRSCNLRYATPNHILVVFHNLRRYDAHLFIRQLDKKFNSGDVGVIVENKEKYISFSVNVAVAKYIDKEGNERERNIQLRFIDSIQFMGSSLDSLSRNLTDC